jgi:hypothetical protein
MIIFPDQNLEWEIDGDTRNTSRLGMLDHFRQGSHVGRPGSVQGLHLAVDDIEAARAVIVALSRFGY